MSAAPVTKNTFDHAHRAAAATNSPFLFGVRPDGKMFVHCDGIEVDGTWSGSTPALVTEISHRLLTNRANAERAIREADASLRFLDGAK